MLADWTGVGFVRDDVPMDPISVGLTELAHRTVDALFDRHREVFGANFDTYRGHVQRVLGLTALQVPLTEELVGPVSIAAFYHDAAIWFDRTWDYLPRSKERAVAALEPEDSEYAPLVKALIDEHHRLRHARDPHPLVEAMRRADATDVYRLKVPANVDRAAYRLLLRRYPSAGLHAMLGRAFIRGLRENPRNPMPMIKF